MKFDVWRVGYQCLELRAETPADADLLHDVLVRHGHRVQWVPGDECALLLRAATPPRKRPLTLNRIEKQPGVPP